MKKTEKTEKDLRQWARDLQDWWKDDSGGIVLGVTIQMVEKGIEPEDAKNIVESIVSVMAAEYGD